MSSESLCFFSQLLMEVQPPPSWLLFIESLNLRSTQVLAPNQREQEQCCSPLSTLAPPHRVRVRNRDFSFSVKLWCFFFFFPQSGLSKGCDAREGGTGAGRAVGRLRFSAHFPCKPAAGQPCTILHPLHQPSLRRILHRTPASPVFPKLLMLPS